MIDLKKQLLSFILVLMLVLSLVSCRPSDLPSDESGDVSGTSESVTSGDPAREFTITSNYYIVRSEHTLKSEETLDAMRYLRDAISNVYGVSTRLKDDWYRESTGLVPDEYEILIGLTNRPQSSELMKDLKINDYAYFVESENVIVICGGSPAATLEAVKKFCADAFGYDGEKGEENKPVKEGMSYTYRAEYDNVSVNLNGSPLENFTVAIPSYSNYLDALSIVEALSEYNGYAVPIKRYTDLTGDEKNVICLGASDVSGVADDSLGQYMCKLSAASSDNGVIVGIDSTYSENIARGAKKFVDSLSVEKSGDTVKLSFPENEAVYSYSFEDDIPVWNLREETKTDFADGVTYVEQLYYDENSKPYKAYVLLIDPKKATLYMGTTNDGYEYSLDGITKQNVAGHMSAALANGVNAIAGINADFFEINGNYHPRGLAIKEGKYIGGPANRPWCGFTYDGQLVIGETSDYTSKYEGKLKTAVGGSNIIVKNGIPFDIQLSTEFSYTAHPRTLVGVREDGTIILAVVDGRQTTISNGAPLARCAMLMMSFGAKDAINLDGGGSSCMVLKVGDNYKTMNSPSDGSLRKVYNSLLVVPVS